MRKMGGAIGALAVALLALGPASASAAIVGSDLRGAPAPNTGWGCGLEPCALQQARLPGGKHKVPFNGVIRKWRLRTVDGIAADRTTRVRLRVLRKRPNGKYRFVRRSKPRAVAETVGRFVFRARLKVRKGDTIGLQLPKNDDNHLNGFFLEGVPRTRLNAFYPALPNGQAAHPDPSPGFELMLNATVKRKRR